jgi:RNA polymerase sigma-70 factor (ECF subfamily)
VLSFSGDVSVDPATIFRRPIVEDDVELEAFDKQGHVSDVAVVRGFYRQHLATVYGYSLRLCGGNRAEAEDLTQDAFVSLATRLQHGDREVLDVRWVLTVVRSRFIDRHRRRLRGQRALSVFGAVATDEHLDDHDDAIDSGVLEHLDALEPQHRLVLIMRYVDGRSVPEIAAAIDRTVTATNSLLARARTELRERMGVPR